jgi:hypothetical protein
MTMLGAQLDDLGQLAGQLTTTTSDIGASSSRCTSLTSSVVSNVQQAAQDALQSIGNEMEALRATVDAAGRSADAAQWTGGNADRFRSAYVDFNGAMAAAERTTNETFADFKRLIENMTTELNEYVTKFNTSLDQAQQATQSMSSAVTSQQNALDQVMNTGISIG